MTNEFVIGVLNSMMAIPEFNRREGTLAPGHNTPEPVFWSTSFDAMHFDIELCFITAYSSF